MRTDLAIHAHSSRLRFVFIDTVKSFHLGANPTLGDIARAYGNLSDCGHGNPLVVDITVGRSGQPVLNQAALTE